jgi:hypothetical protein
MKMEMKIGKILIIVGAILTLVSTFFFSFGETAGTDGRTLISGIGFLFNFPDIMGNAAVYWVGFNGGVVTLEYTFAIIFLIFLLSGVIQLVGFVNKYVAIIGSIIAIVFGIYLIIVISHSPPWNLNRYSSLFWRAPIAVGVWPLEVPVVDVNNFAYQHLSLGTITLFIGGGIGLAGGILGIKDI